MSVRDDTTQSSLSVFQEAELYFNKHDEDSDEIVFFGDDAPSVTPTSSHDGEASDDTEKEDEYEDELLETISADGSDMNDRQEHSPPSSHVYTYGSAFDTLDDDEEEEAGADSPFAGYSKKELAQPVKVVQSSKDSSTGKFLRETRDVRWCLSNGCEQVKPGVWSKEWYFTYLYGEKEGHRSWSDVVNRRLAKQRDGKAFKLANDDFCEMLRVRSKGNRAFSRGQYKTALDCYLKAENIMGGAVSGIYLVPHQREELVKILSNQAECYLRMNKYQSSIMQASAALQLDKRHEKSLLRRAKAIVYGAEQYKVLDDMIASQASDDLRVIIGIKGNGIKEAEAFLEELDRKVQRAKVRQQ